MIPAEMKLRIVLSVLQGEVTVAEAAGSRTAGRLPFHHLPGPP